MVVSYWLKIFVAIVSFTAVLSSNVLVESIGYITNQVVFDHCLLVTSNNNLAACINKSSGEISWKFHLPLQSIDHSLAIGEGKLFILSTNMFEKEEYLTVQALSVNSGLLLWETTLPSDSTFENLVGFAYIEHLHSVECLFKKSIQLIDVNEGVKLITWEIKDVDSPLELQPLSNSYNHGSGYLAQGCLVGPWNNCEELVFLNYDMKSKEFSTKKVDSFNSKLFSNQTSALLSGSVSGDILYSMNPKFDQHNLKLSIDFVHQSLHTLKTDRVSTTIELNQYGFERESKWNKNIESFVTFVSADDLRPTVAITLKSEKRYALFIFEATLVGGQWNIERKRAFSESSPSLSFVGLAKEMMVKPSLVQSYEVVTIDNTISSANGNQLQIVRQSYGLKINLSPALYCKNDVDPQFTLGRNSIYTVLDNGVIFAASKSNDDSNQIGIDWSRNEGLGNIQEGFVISPEEVANDALAAQNTFNILNILTDSPTDHKHQVFVGASYVKSAGLSFQQARLQLHFIDLSSNGCFVRTVRPVLSPSLSKSTIVIRSIRVIPVFNFEEYHHSANNVTLAVDTEENGVLLWKVDVKSMLSSVSLKAKCSVYTNTIVDSFAVENTDSLPNVGKLLSLYPSSTNLFKLGGEVTMLFADDENIAKVVTTHSTNHLAHTMSSVYFHSINVTNGVITIFQNTQNDCENFFVSVASCKQGVETSRIVFDPEVEKIVDVTYPAFGDKVYSRAATLGDSNVLLKYLNPNLMVVITTTIEGLEDGSLSNIESKMFINIFDTVSGKLLQRIAHESATEPVASVIIENFVVVSYWNAKAKRTEVSSVGLYDGFIGKYDFSAFKADSKFADKKSPLGAVRSGYSTTLPLVMQRTYVIPGKVLHLSHTMSGKGINNKNLLVTFSSGQIYNLDFRMFHPRRPLSDPTPAEKEEGLIKYFPFIFLSPTAIVSSNSSISLSNDLQVISASSKLESRSLIVSYGVGCDVFIKTIIPSQGFDTLSEDFNYLLLIALIGGLAGVVFVLYIASAKVTLQRLWR